MGDKIYAVKKGKKPGLYKSWSACKKQVEGFKGAIYKSFTDEKEAKEFLDGEDNSFDKVDFNKLVNYSFVDGSFNPATNVYGCGGFVVASIKKEDSDEYEIKRIVIKKSGDDKDMAAMRNIAGEILGAMESIKVAIKLGLPELTIIYDYYGIEMWATGKWARNKECTKAYYDFIQSINSKIKLHFIKVKGHTGIDGNEEADKLAKSAVGIE